jgi:PAS domain S-box-containing protein
MVARRVLPPEPGSPSGRIARYALALLIVAVAVLLRFAVDPLIHDQIPFIIFVAAVVVATWVGDFGGGIVATVAAAVSGNYFFVEPRYHLKPTHIGELSAIAVFVAVALGLVWFVSRWKRAEGSLREQAERLRVQAMLLEHAHDAIFVRDPQERVTFWNRGAEQLYGWTAEEAIGRNSHTLLRTQFPESLEHVQHCLATEGEWQGDLVHTRRDGAQVISQSRHVLVRDERGGPSLVLEINRDITQRRRAEQERERLYGEAERANRVKDEFLSTLSHELRTPLNAILGWSHMLLAGALDGEQQQHALRTIARNAEAQARLVDDVLDVSRIISGKLRLDLRPVDLETVIRAALETVRPAAEAKGIEVRTSFTYRPLVLGDADRLQQVAWNLLSNAVKFTPRHGRVEVGVEARESHIDITVADTGMGIGADFLPHLFERFTQRDSSTARSHAGLGLGLAIVRHLVELHGGTVAAESSGEGRGAVFTVALPVRPLVADGAEVGPHAAEGRVASSGLTAPSLRGVRVLVVDDEPDARELLSSVLGQFGAQVRTAASAREGLRLVREWCPDVLLADIGMPVEDGYMLIKQVRSLPASGGGQTPAVALTAYGRPEDRLRALSAGYQRHVPKPAKPNELGAVVASLARSAPEDRNDVQARELRE